MESELLDIAIRIVKAQAGISPMTAGEVCVYVQEVMRELNAALASEGEDEQPLQPARGMDPKSSIKETTITCLECGRTFKVLGNRHLRTHGLDAKSYKEKWGFRRDTKLSCRSLVRDRRKRMNNDLKLWERRKAVRKDAQALENDSGD